MTKINATTKGGSSGSTTTTGQVTMDFGATEDFNTTVTVTTALVTSASIIRVSPTAIATADHDPDDYAAEGITAYATNIVNGVSFDIMGSAPNSTWGKYLVNWAF